MASGKLHRRGRGSVRDKGIGRLQPCQRFRRPVFHVSNYILSQTHPFNPTRVFLKNAPSLAVASIASRLQGLTHLRVVGSIIDAEPIVLALPALKHLFYQPHRAHSVGQVSVFSSGLCNMLREAVKLRRIVLILPTVGQQIPETQ